ncbi:MAG TPA: Rrf2 family transcriptional regulator [Planctomycetes bacterium]|nr:Rrf2 family transcriptional regulator [Planctomycetota bacterium]
MLRLSKKGDYSVFLMATLARHELLHRESRQSPPGSLAAPPVPEDNRSQVPTMSASELSKLSGLGRSYVANLLKDFAKAGLLTSVRGQQGGYRLARPPEAISLRETLAVIEGPLRFVGCADSVHPQDAFPQSNSARGTHSREDSPKNSQQHNCDLFRICPSVGPMQVIHNRIVNLLEGLSLAELARSGQTYSKAIESNETEQVQASDLYGLQRHDSL